MGAEQSSTWAGQPQRGRTSSSGLGSLLAESATASRLFCYLALWLVGDPLVGVGRCSWQPTVGMSIATDADCFMAAIPIAGEELTHGEFKIGL